MIGTSLLKINKFRTKRQETVFSKQTSMVSVGVL